MPFSLPPLVADFVAAHLRSVDDLHLLVATRHDPERWWDADAVARELALDPEEALGLLEHLAAHNLLDIRMTGDVRYRYRPGTAQLAAAAEACVDTYRRTPAAIWRALAAGRGARAMSDFANAFRIRRDDR
jgi:hypothetical protein